MPTQPRQPDEIPDFDRPPTADELPANPASIPQPPPMPDDYSVRGIASHINEQYGDHIKHRVKETATENVKYSLRYMAYKFLMAFTLNNDWNEERLAHRLASGEKLSFYEFFFGEKFSIFGAIRMAIGILFALGVLGFLVYLNSMGGL